MMILILLINMSKLELKQQAKALLLKGCYRMAYNKYNRLIEMGSEGFNQREWAIINLNQGICLQFQQQYDKAIDSVNRSLQIDPTYEKAYYRKLQILRETGRLEEAIHAIPIWIKNKQVEGLSKDIKEEYLNSMGMDQILEALLAKKTQPMQFIKQSHSKFMQRVIEALDSEYSSQHLKIIGDKIASYYKHLKQEKMDEILQSLLSKIHFILIKQKQSKKTQLFNVLLKSFWRQYQQMGEPMISDQISNNDIIVKEEFKIIKYAPIGNKLLNFVEKLLMKADIKKEQMFQLAFQLINNLSQSEKQPVVSGMTIYEIILKFIGKINNELSRQNLNWIKRSFMLVDSMIKFHLLLQPELSFQSLNLTNIFYLHYYFINDSSDTFQIQKTAFKKQKNEPIVAYLSQNIQNFLIVYTFQHFVHRLDRTLLKEIVSVIDQQVQMIKQLKDLTKNKKNNKTLQVQLQNQYMLLYTSLLLKIDLKNQSDKISISSILNKNKMIDGLLSDLQINTLLLLSISRKENLIQILQNIDCVTTVINQFVAGSFSQQIQSVKVVTSFVYLLVVDLEEEQEENFAKKMGTTVEEIQKARQIQGQKAEAEISKKLSVSQAKCREYISKNWIDLIPSYCDLLSKIKDEPSLMKWGKFLNEVGRIDHTRFFNPKIVTILFECFKVEKKAVGELLSIMCKKVNVGLIKYQYLQSITNILVHNVEHSDDQLVIFQSLLGLINITSNSNTKVRIPIKIISNAVFEENKYIVHAACSLLNNLLALDEDEITKQTNLKDIVQKYVKFYREQIENDEGVPLSDYAHPSRVYSTLLSLAMVLDLDHIEQFQDWTNLEPCLLNIKTSKSEILYKSVWYMSMKERLKAKWWPTFQKDLLELKEADNQRWLKLQHYIKR